MTGCSKNEDSIHGMPSSTGRSVETVAPDVALCPLVTSMVNTGRSVATMLSDMAQS